jgi:hypothetical protein
MSSHKTVYPGNKYSKNVKVDRTFAKNFSSAKNVLWKVSEDEFIANFKIKDRLAMAWFTKKGRLNCVNYYSDGKYLPETEKEIVSQKYPGYEVTATLEIDKKDIKAYIVTLQNCTLQKKVKFIDGELEEMETLKLAK